MMHATGLPCTRPLEDLSVSDRRTVHVGCGMHSSCPSVRTGVDAFELRSDLDAEDACLTALRLGRAVIAQLELLETHPDLPAAFRDVVQGIANLCRLESGGLGVVQAAFSRRPDCHP